MNINTSILRKISRKTLALLFAFMVTGIAFVGFNIMSAQAVNITIDVLNGEGDFETAFANWTQFNTGTYAWSFSNSSAQFRGTKSALQYFAGSSTTTRTATGGYRHGFTTPAGLDSAELAGYWFKTTGSTTRTTRFDTKWEVRNAADTLTIASGTIDSTEPVSSGWQPFSASVTGLSPNTTYILKLITDSIQSSGGTTINNAYWDDIVLNVTYADNPPAAPVMTAPANSSNQKGTISLQSTATDDYGVSSVTFEYADNTAFTGATALNGATMTAGTATNGTWSLDWNTSGLNGTYYVRAVSKDAQNQSTNGTYFTYYLDNTVPTTAAVSVPADTAYIKGILTLTANAQDNSGITGLDFEYDDDFTFTGGITVSGATRTAGTALNGTWTKAGFDTTGLVDGTWYFRAKAQDAAGNILAGPVNTVEVDNTNPTSISVSSPSAGSVVYGTLNLTANAQDAQRIQSVTFEYDDNTDFSSPAELIGAVLTEGSNINGTWSYTGFDTTGLTDGTLYLRAKTTDAAGNSLTGSYITVTVHNAPPTAAVVTAPANNTDLTGSVEFTANAQDLIGVAAVDFEYSADAGFTSPGVLSGAARTSGTAQNGNWSKTVDTSALGDGNFYIRAKATDLSGHILRGAAVNVDIDNFPPQFAVQYFSDVALTQPLLVASGKPVTKAQTVYVKVIPNEGLVAAPTISIDAMGTANDRSNVVAPLSGGSYVYEWDVVSDTDGQILVTVSGTDNFTKTAVNTVPTSGGTLVLDTVVAMPSLSGQKAVGKVFLNWSTDVDQQRYIIYRSTEEGFVPDDDTNKIAEIPAPASSYTDVIAAGVYFYKIIAIDTAGNTSSYSLEVTAKSIGSTTTMRAYWDDTEGSTAVYWANDMTASGAEPNWQSATVNDPGTANAYIVVANTQMYENYYLKVVTATETKIIKAFPTAGSTGQEDWIDSGYAHGNFARDTQLCGACHSTHSGLKNGLLQQATYYELCIFCHGTASTQSKYDVQAGKVMTADGWKDSLAGPIGTDYGVSKHNVDDRDDVTTPVFGSAPGKTLTFTCLSCHKPHAGEKDNYRLLRDTIYPSDDKFTSTNINFEGYAVVNDPAVGEEEYLISGSSEFCAACHFDYMQGSALEAGGTFGSKYYRHPVTVSGAVYSVYGTSPAKNLYPEAPYKFPLQVNAAGESVSPDKRTAVVCLTCHYAHGSNKAFNMGYPMPNGLPRVYVQNQKMLRLDNYGVCEACHQK